MAMQEAPLEAGPRLYRNLTLVVLVLCLGSMVDLILDRPETIWSLHILFELSLLVFGLGAVAYFWLQWARARRSLVATQAEMRIQKADRDAWRARAEKFLIGLGAEIDGQLRDWGLTPAERETALLLLKGLGHGEIAGLQGKSERTVRQHAGAVYRKSGLSGRAELSAFFLEDLLLPSSEE